MGLTIGEKVGRLFGGEPPEVNKGELIDKMNYATLISRLVNSSGFEGLNLLLDKRAAELRGWIRPGNEDKYHEVSLRLDEIEQIRKNIEMAIKEGNKAAELLEHQNNKTKQAEPA